MFQQEVQPALKQKFDNKLNNLCFLNFPLLPYKCLLCSTLFSFNGNCSLLFIL